MDAVSKGRQPISERLRRPLGQLVVLCLFTFAGCSSNIEQTETPLQSTVVEQQTAGQQTVDPQVIATIESAFGSMERRHDGTIVGVDLAQARSSVNDEVLNAALTIPGLKKLRVAGNAISRETLLKISGQTHLEELFLQDTVINDDDLAVILPAMPELKRLTLRRCVHVTDQAAELFLAQSSLRNLALIEMNVGRKTLETLTGSQTMTALDLRSCSRLTPEDYALLVKMPQLTDLKIGGFGMDNSVLEHVAQLPNLTGLTVEDAMISPDALTRMIETAAWKGKLTQLVLSRNTMLFDVGLAPIQSLPKLRRLTVNGMMITGTFLIQMAENESMRPKLESLSLRKAFLTVEGAKALQQYRELKSLDLSGVAMTEELVEIIATLDTLEALNLTECRMTDEMARPIRNMPNVKSLVLADNPMTNP
jgi:hypothetical protein